MVIIECKSTEIIIFENIIITDENIRGNTDALKYFFERNFFFFERMLLSIFIFTILTNSCSIVRAFSMN